MTLTDFLLARIGEDEAVAERGGSHPDPTTFARDNYGYLWVQPARVLAECEAKRQIVEDAYVADCIEDDLGTMMEKDRAWPYVGERILRYLAAIYADHPDYREEWKP